MPLRPASVPVFRGQRHRKDLLKGKDSVGSKTKSTNQLANTKYQAFEVYTHSHQPHLLLLPGLSVSPTPAPNPALICGHSPSCPHWSPLACSFTPPTQLRPSEGGGTAQTRRKRPQDLFPCRFLLLPGIPFSAFSRLSESGGDRHFAPRALVTSCVCAAWTPAGERRTTSAALRLLLLGCRSFGIMAPSLWKGLVGVGLFALAHAAFSAAQRKCLRDGDGSREGHQGLCGGAPLRDSWTQCRRAVLRHFRLG